MPTYGKDYGPCYLMLERTPGNAISEAISEISLQGEAGIDRTFEQWKKQWNLPVKLGVPSHVYFGVDEKRIFQASAGGVGYGTWEEYSDDPGTEIIACKLAGITPETITEMLAIMEAMSKKKEGYAYIDLGEDAIIALTHLNAIFPSLNTREGDQHDLFCSGVGRTVIEGTKQYADVFRIHQVNGGEAWQKPPLAFYGVAETSPLMLAVWLPFESVQIVKEVV